HHLGSTGGGAGDGRHLAHHHHADRHHQARREGSADLHAGAAPRARPRSGVGAACTAQDRIEALWDALHLGTREPEVARMKRKRKMRVTRTLELLCVVANREARRIGSYGWRPTQHDLAQLRASTGDASAYRATMRAWRAAGFRVRAIRKLAG